MKCRICGHRANSIKTMAWHYRHKHPRAMAHRKHSGGHRGPREARGSSRAMDRLERLIKLLG